MELSSFCDVLYSFKRFVFLSVHVQPAEVCQYRIQVQLRLSPVDFEPTDSQLADGEVDTDTGVSVLRPGPGGEVDAAPDVGQLARVDLAHVPGQQLAYLVKAVLALVRRQAAVQDALVEVTSGKNAKEKRGVWPQFQQKTKIPNTTMNDRKCINPKI